MTTGQVKWFDPKKGYGFIIGPDGQDVFVHYSHIQAEGFRALKDGEWVDYDLVQGDKGWQARNVHQRDKDQEDGQAQRGSPAGDEKAEPEAPPIAQGYQGADDESGPAQRPSKPRAESEDAPPPPTNGYSDGYSSSNYSSGYSDGASGRDR